MIDSKLIEKKLKSIFKDASFEVSIEGNTIRIAIEGIGEDPQTLLSKVGEVVGSLNRFTKTSNADIIVSIQSTGYGVEIEIY